MLIANQNKNKSIQEKRFKKDSKKATVFESHSYNLINGLGRNNIFPKATAVNSHINSSFDLYAMSSSEESLLTKMKSKLTTTFSGVNPNIEQTVISDDNPNEISDSTSKDETFSNLKVDIKEDLKSPFKSEESILEIKQSGSSSEGIELEDEQSERENEEIKLPPASLFSNLKTGINPKDYISKDPFETPLV